MGVVILAAMSGLLAAPEAKVDFAREIKPLFSDRCYACHGPDASARKARLRLDLSEGPFGDRGGKGPVIRPGDPAASELYRRITAADPSERMPPPDSKLALSAAEVERVRRWIEEGAPWRRHWAFEPVGEVPVPELRGRAWVRNAVDCFVSSRLEREGLAPSPEASRERWLRRATLDLTGLPPTPEEVDAFLADESPDAFERAAGRLLAAPDLGERLAVDWLDLARYADTHGYQADRYRPMWPWRDWVISAFNRGLPYDQFVTWQLAGDLLPGATKEQRLATAFNRNHMQTEEGGSVEEEFRVAYVSDRVNTFGTAFLGLALECARCHDHKYDPIAQREYYRLFAFFNSIDESGQTSHFTDSMPVPTLLLTDEATDRRLASLRGAVRERETALEQLRGAERAPFQAWLERRPREPSVPGLAGDYPLDALLGGKAENHADPSKPGEAFEDPQLVPGVAGNGLLLSGENGVAFKGTGVFSRVDPFTLALWVQAPAALERATVIHRTKASLDAGSRGYEVLLEKGHVSVGLVHMWPHNSVKVRSAAPLAPGRWVHLAVTYDGSSRSRGLVLYLDGDEAEVDVVRDNLYKDILYERVDVDLTLGQRFRDNGFKGGRADEVKVYARALSALEVAEVAGKGRLAEVLSADPAALEPRRLEGLFDYYLTAHSAAWRKGLEELRAARAELNGALNPIPEAMVMEEMPSPRPAHVLRRGQYDAPGERVEPGTPAAIGELLPADLPRNRLGLARWLLDPSNPLTARVAVNRYWQLVFGRGIVRTAEDFGSQGAPPTHPELLDWLARRFVESGWDVKDLLKLMVLSATYRQSSAASPELLARDPENLLLGRAPSPRLSAETLRDQALAASGLLVRKVGGPSVKPYQPEGLWEEKSGARYEPDVGEGLYRKSLYTFWKRTSPHPAMILFDAAERNTCIVRRQPTTTPLQALVLLNDPQLFEAARKVGERALKAGPTAEDRAAYAFRLFAARAPSAREREVLAGLYREELEMYRRDPESARAVVTVGVSGRDPSLDPAELAAAAAVASAVLSFDESICKR
ncbi:MAG: DUF1553 domain-containing protein [Planctomycetes bacterium]|nr:DUF1553 domain-containing protein [Planctomycetota bacterium]